MVGILTVGAFIVWVGGFIGGIVMWADGFGFLTALMIWVGSLIEGALLFAVGQIYSVTVKPAEEAIENEERLKAEKEVDNKNNIETVAESNLTDNNES